MWVVGGPCRGVVTLVSTMLVAAVLVLMAGLHRAGIAGWAMIAGLACDTPRPVLGAVIAELAATHSGGHNSTAGACQAQHGATSPAVGGVVAGWLDPGVVLITASGVRSAGVGRPLATCRCVP